MVHHAMAIGHGGVMHEPAAAEMARVPVVMDGMFGAVGGDGRRVRTEREQRKCQRHQKSKKTIPAHPHHQNRTSIPAGRYPPGNLASLYLKIPGLGIGEGRPSRMPMTPRLRASSAAGRFT